MSLNSMAFTPEQVEAGLHIKLLEYFDVYNKLSEDKYIECHIVSDSYCTIVEWKDVPHDHSYGGTFQYIDEEHEVVDIHLDNDLEE